MPVPKGYTLEAPSSMPAGYTLEESPETTTPPVQDFSAPSDNKEGVYEMIHGESNPAKVVSVPYSKVMDASKAGYKISPKAHDTYKQDRMAELKAQGHEKDHPLELPEAYTEIGPAPLMGSPEWFKQKAYGVEHAVLDALPTAGGVVGGIIGGGAAAPTGPGAIGTAALGAAAGGGLGEDIRQVAEEHLFPDEPKMTAKESANKLAEEATMQGASEATGRLISKPLKAATKYFGDTALASKNAGVPLLPSEAHGNAPSYAEKFLKGSVMTSGKMEKFRTLQNTATQAAVDKVADAIAISHGTPEELGKAVQEGIAQHTKNFRLIQNAAYADVAKDVGERTEKIPVIKNVPTGVLDSRGQPIVRPVTTYVEKVVDNVMPSTVELKKFAAQELKKLDQAEKILDPSLLSSSRSMLQTLATAPDRMPYSAIASARSDALALTRRLDEALPGKQAGLAKKMAELFDTSMIDAAEKSGIKGLPEKIRAANALTANEHQMFEQALVKKVVETKKPEVIATLIRGNNIGLDETRDLFKILPKELHAPVQRQIITDTMRQSTNLRSGVFNERRFADTILNMGDERGKVVFGDNWKTVRRLSQIMGSINGPVGREGGSGASLQNFAILKNALLLAVPGGEAARGNYSGAATSLAGEWATLSLLAYGMTHPEIAVRMLKIADAFARTLPYAVSGVANEAQGHKQMKKGKAQEQVDKLKSKTPAEVKKQAEEKQSPTSGGEASVSKYASPSELIQRAKELHSGFQNSGMAPV